MTSTFSVDEWFIYFRLFPGASVVLSWNGWGLSAKTNNWKRDYHCSKVDGKSTNTHFLWRTSICFFGSFRFVRCYFYHVTNSSANGGWFYWYLDRRWWPNKTAKLSARPSVHPFDIFSFSFYSSHLNGLKLDRVTPLCITMNVTKAVGCVPCVCTWSRNIIVR